MAEDGSRLLTLSYGAPIAASRPLAVNYSADLRRAWSRSAMMSSGSSTPSASRQSWSVMPRA